MIFEKKCRKSTYDKYYFQINDDKIDIANNYTYLGTNFSANGSFRNCKTNLKNKTRNSTRTAVTNMTIKCMLENRQNYLLELEVSYVSTYIFNLVVTLIINGHF